MNSQISFTNSRLDNLPKPTKTGGRLFFRDTVVKGLRIQVTDKGVKTFQVSKRLEHGKPVIVTLGRYDALTIDAARKKASIVISQLMNGINPNETRKITKIKALTLKEVFEDYLKMRPNLKDGTIYTYQRTVKHNFADWLDKPLVSLTTEAVQKKFFAIGSKSKAVANKAFYILKAVFNHAIRTYKDGDDNPVFSRNPVLALNKSWFDVPRKTRHIKDYQIKQFFDAINELKPTDGGLWLYMKTYLLLALFTGSRRKEILSLRWENVDFENKTLMFDDTKNKHIHVLPLTDFLATTLKTHKAAQINNETFVFQSKKARAGYIAHPEKMLKKIQERAGIQFSMHDLRRTFATIARKLNIISIKKLINHSEKNDVTAGYIILDEDDLRKPMDDISAYILNLASN